MAVLALVLLATWIGLVAGLRGYIQFRRTGNIGMSFRDRPGSPQWWARLISSLGLVLAIAAPLAALNGLPAVAPLDDPTVAGVGFMLVVLGIVGTLAAQSVMGDSWRGDVDLDARTALVTHGPFRFVRNPILTATTITGVGLVLMVPNVLAVVMLGCFLSAQQIQVRLVEEPYLLRVHGEAYRAYASRTGRFVPWIGRLSP
jgi:protein-S-isoprenylcysteine O-methyltransferase Ste14